MSEHRETQIYRDIALYLKMQYPKVMYHFDPTGLNLTKTQAGILKSIQGGKGYPDLFIIEPSKDRKYIGLFIEVKKEGTNLYKNKGIDYIDDHVLSQALCLDALERRGYRAVFGIGFDVCKSIIDKYLKG